MFDTSLTYVSGILSTLSLDKVSPLQTVILCIIYHKKQASSTAILQILNDASPRTLTPINRTNASTVYPYSNTPPFRSQSSISHSLSDLCLKCLIIRDNETGNYSCTEQGHEYLGTYIKLAESTEKNMQHLRETLSEMHGMHVENAASPC